MRRTYQSMLTVGSATLILAGTAFAAGPPVPYDAWKVTAGVVEKPAGGALDCPATWTCGTPLTGDGFLQRSLTKAGIQYFQTIITNTGVTGIPSALAFADESFVLSGGANGIADRQRVNDIAAGLTNTNELNMGWAQSTPGPAAPELSLNQALTIPNGLTPPASDAFSISFSLVSDNAGADRIMNIGQSVALGTTTDRQGFKLVQANGSYVLGASSPASTQTPDSVTWVDGDQVQAIWVGQELPVASQKFGYQAFDNLTTAQSKSYSDLADSGVNGLNVYTWDWPNPPFGTAPSF